MQELKLRKEFFHKVLDGTKTSTSRKGIRNVTCGILMLVMTEDESIKQPVFVNNIKITHLKDIDDEEAIKEGYKTAKELVTALSSIYPNINNDELITIIEFRAIQ